MRLKKYVTFSFFVSTALFSLYACIYCFCLSVFFFLSLLFSIYLFSQSALFQRPGNIHLGSTMLQKDNVFLPVPSTTRSILSSMILANVSNYLTADRRGVNLISDVMWKITFLLQKFVPN